MARSLNKVQLIGNLTRDPELRYTPAGNAVVTFGLATNRSWKTDAGELREETDFHRVVAWNKLAEICSQFLFKGKKAYVEGRLSTRKWTGQDGVEKLTTEIVIDDMILLDNKREEHEPNLSSPDKTPDQPLTDEEKEHFAPKQSVKAQATKKVKKEEPETAKEEEVEPDDIPF
jgi:single-strand DNA-binding protein